MGPAFSKEEFRTRLGNAREALRRAGLEGCVCVGPENLYYLGGYDGFTYGWEQALVFGVGDDEPTLVVRDIDHSLAMETTWLDDVRTYHYGTIQPNELVAQLAREKGFLGKRVGADLSALALTGSYAMRLQEALGASNLEDATGVISKLRWVQSPGEIDYSKRAAEYANAGLRATLEKARPGMTEIQLASEIEYAMRSRGSEYSAAATLVASGLRTLAGHACPTERVMGQGDLVHTEFAGIFRRYHCVAMRTFSLGEPSSRVRELYDATLESLRAGVAAIRADGPVSASEQASLESLERRGLEKYAVMRFGLGISAGYPPFWGNGLDLMRESEDTFQPNMIFYVHSWLEVPEDRVGILIGGSYLLTNEGPQRLDDNDFQLEVV